MSEAVEPGKLGIKIERPFSEHVSFFYYLLAVLTIGLIGFTAWLLILEWMEGPLPLTLRSLIAW